jgi:hypothetical protein
MYQVGQAVIYDTPYKRNCLAFSLSDATLCSLDTEKIEGQIFNERPATEAEILAEAVKHGWTAHNIINIDSPSADVYLQRDYANSPWKISHAGFVEDYSIFGQECITAHRLITALNLAK